MDKMSEKSDSSIRSVVFEDLTITEIAQIIAIPGNDRCVDCDCPRPEWASLGFGTLICLDCAGYHRSLGVHISLVRSMKMDSWSATQKTKLLRGGNKKWNDYIASLRSESTAAGPGTTPGSKALRMHAKYVNPEVLYYREIIQAECDERPATAYDAAFWKEVVNPGKSPMLARQSSSPKWVDDATAAECNLCGIPFTLMRRRHHCRRCGKCICKICAPTDNTRPILEWGMLEPVRHCKECYMNPTLNWG